MRSGAVCVVELRHPRDVQVEHVLLDLKIHVDFMTNNNNVMSVSIPARQGYDHTWSHTKEPPDPAWDPIHKYW